MESPFFKPPREAKIGLKKWGKISVFDEEKEITFGFSYQGFQEITRGVEKSGFLCGFY